MIKYYQQRGTREDALSERVDFESWNAFMYHLDAKYSFLFRDPECLLNL